MTPRGFGLDFWSGHNKDYKNVHNLTQFDLTGQSTYDTKGKTAIDSAYRYDPRFDKWLQIASLNEKRTFFHLSALAGKLFAVGGRNASGEIGKARLVPVPYMSQSWLIFFLSVFASTYLWATDELAVVLIVPKSKC